MNDYEIYMRKENYQRTLEYMELIDFLITKSSLRKWSVNCTKYTKLSSYIHSIVKNGWYTYRPYELFLNRIEKIDQWSFNDIRSLPDSVYKKIDYVESNLSNEDPRVTDKRVNIFKSVFVGSLRTAIMQSHFNKKVTLSLNEAKNNLDEMKNGIYTSLITILGIFVAIMVAVFGGVQSFGNLFENANKLGFGKSISLSAVALFGIYLIMLLLFNGISRLTHHANYRFPIGFNIYLISNFIIVFLLGMACSGSYVSYLYMNHLGIRLIICLIISVLIVFSYFVWRHPYNKKLHRCHKKNSVKY